MFSAADLTELITDQPDLGVSILMPTHVSGKQTQQDPLRFKNLLSEASSRLTELGCSTADSDRVLKPARSLTDDREFWQHQDLGLAVFLAGGEIRIYTLPVSVTDQVVVGHGYHVTPLLPLVASNETFYVATVTSQEVAMFRASRFEMSRVDYEGPLSVEDQGTGSDYQNPVQASPVARPHTGSVDISHAQVYGDSPEEWRKGRLVDYARRVAIAIDQCVARDPAPVVLVASTELNGHVRRASTLTPATLWSIDADPASMDQAQLRHAAYAVLEPHLMASREQTWERFRELRGRHDERAATYSGALVRLADQGRIDTLLVSERACIGGMLDGDRPSNPAPPRSRRPRSGDAQSRRQRLGRACRPARGTPGSGNPAILSWSPMRCRSLHGGAGRTILVVLSAKCSFRPLLPTVGSDAPGSLVGNSVVDPEEHPHV